MDSLKSVWQSILDEIAKNITSTAYNTWFSDCEPVELGETSLIIQTTSDFKRSVIQGRFGDVIRAALREIFSCEMELVVLTPEEIEFQRQRHHMTEIPPEMDGYTFDRFVVGPSNKFAHAAAIAVAENPGRAYNPLFIYGNSGLGKTHLLLAIGQRIHDHNPESRIVYVSGDDFTNDMVHSIRNGTMDEFRNKYRNVDLLLVDDIQFIAGKQSTQEEFFNTFNNIYNDGHQIVITADRPPMEMSLLDDRLRTRFEGGLMADVQPPDLETRTAIIRNKAAQLGMSLPDDVVTFIAENITSNVREIMDDGITINSVKRAIKDVIRVGAYIPTPDVIIEETARYFSITSSDIRGQRRSKNVAKARQVSMYLIRNLTNLSLVDIGSQYEGRNHSTVLTSIRKIEELIKTDQETSATVRDISSNINSRS